ncbi:hypothetical protein [Actinokineospora fastidiosa]|uniref:Uncharacterized protein n=1 Tax=Actinokineospora fastidiosa TaxID=1816 RepID=A0A918G6C4_9PSEU|nr:hypothetical protein [Actinokineospora fastidiosa]GGS21610.1 hypothetical protein GCM10010171_12930 [Actinokineospora fastidiosa]
MNENPRPVEERITELEREVASIREVAEDARVDAKAARTLAAGTDRDLAVIREQQKADRSLIQALRDTQIEHGQRLTRLEEKVDRGFERIDLRFEQIDRNFDQVNENFAHVDRKFAVVTAGIEHITTLLTDHIEKSN